MNVKKYIEPSFIIYINRTLKEVYPDMNLSTDSKRYLQKLITSFLEHFAIYASTMMEQHRSKTLSHKDVQSAIRLFFVGELGKHAISQATKAVTQFTAFVNKKNGVRVSVAEKSGIIFPPSRVRYILENELADYKSDFRISSIVPIYLAAVIEYLIAEILELSGYQETDDYKKTIQIDDIKNVIKKDNELSRTLCRLVGL
jgi:histone H2B